MVAYSGGTHSDGGRHPHPSVGHSGGETDGGGAPPSAPTHPEVVVGSGGI